MCTSNNGMLFLVEAMIDSVDGPQRMINLLTVLNLPSINDRINDDA